MPSLSNWHKFVLRYAQHPNQNATAMSRNRYIIAMHDFIREALANGEEWFNDHYEEFKEIRLDLITHVAWRFK